MILARKPNNYRMKLNLCHSHLHKATGTMKIIRQKVQEMCLPEHWDRYIQSWAPPSESLVLINRVVQWRNNWELSTKRYKQNMHNPAYATVAPDANLPKDARRYRIAITLKKSLLSCPVAATLKTDSAAPIVLARQAKMLLAVSWEICHSRGSTGTEILIWRNSIPRMAREQRRTMRTSAARDTALDSLHPQW